MCPRSSARIQSRSFLNFRSFVQIEPGMPNKGDNMNCPICERDEVKTTEHHLIPKHKGGKKDPKADPYQMNSVSI